ncbi:speckle-type POZ protein-like [Schistocerca cancellata]|uniref:speckle-type POZ protein-like n=1 Tax=Schistocerca cancellata TaxID=274614 RepID=UPI002118949B|nr:speckle-type POZ protein-like [Schistocerca cancellata]
MVQLAVAKDLRCLLDTKDFIDIILSVRGAQLNAHRVMLCTCSPVFRAVLSHDMKEARESLMEIPDLEPTVMLKMLRYMYTDRVHVPSDMTEQLLVASDKYRLQCESDVARQVTVGSAADIAACAVVHSCRFLQKVYVA